MPLDSGPGPQSSVVSGVWATLPFRQPRPVYLLAVAPCQIPFVSLAMITTTGRSLASWAGTKGEKVKEILGRERMMGERPR